MKIRNIPYGYHYVNGTIVTHPQESKIVKDIFNNYLHGNSLLQIAECLTKRSVEYTPGCTSWNKGKIKRILEDKRYLGIAQYPIIIDEEHYQAVFKMKNAKYTQTCPKEQVRILHFNIPIRCPCCNSPMARRVDNRQKIPVKWICKNAECRHMIGKNDEQLFTEIITLLNLLIANPHLINIPLEKETILSIEQIQLNNEIAKLFNSVQIDRNQIKTKLLEYASLKYQELDSAVCIARRLKDTFIAASRLTNFCPLLFEKTVDEIKLYTDGNIGIILTNKQEIKSGGQYGST